MNRTLAMVMAHDVSIALKSVAEKYKMNVKVNGGRFDPYENTYAPKVEFSGTDSAKLGWERYAELRGLPKDGFGKKFVTANRTYEIVGIKPSAYKRPILVKDVVTKR